MKNIIFIMMIISSTYACTIDCYNDTNKSEKDIWHNNLFFNTYYENYDSTYHNLGTSNDTQAVAKLDWTSKLNITDRLAISSTLRAIRWNADTDYQDLAYSDHVAKGGNPNINKDTQLPSYFKNTDRTKELQYSDLHFNSLYVSYILPEIGDYRHMFAVGTMPFVGGTFEYYKHNGPREGTGMSLLINMPLDAFTYVGDLSKMTNLDSFQIRVGVGEYLKFDDIYKHNEKIGVKTKGTTSKFINFDIVEGNHNLKLEAYQSDWQYNEIPVGTLTNVGVGYAYDKLDTDGYVMYGVGGFSNIKGSYNDLIKDDLISRRESIISFVMNAYSVPYGTAAAIVDAQLRNVTNTFVSQVYQVRASETGFIDNVDENGWAYQLGAKKEWWIEPLDVDWFVGGEYFRSSKHWATQQLKGLPRHGIDPATKGSAYELYTGFRNNDSLIVTFSYVKEMRKWGSMYANDVYGLAVSDSNRYLLETREMFKVDLKWMFLGL